MMDNWLKITVLMVLALLFQGLLSVQHLISGEVASIVSMLVWLFVVVGIVGMFAF